MRRHVGRFGARGRVTVQQTSATQLTIRAAGLALVWGGTAAFGLAEYPASVLGLVMVFMGCVVHVPSWTVWFELRIDDGCSRLLTTDSAA